jgi:hypothetical protein
VPPGAPRHHDGVARSIETPEGLTWVVRRRWLPKRSIRWRRLRRTKDGTDASDALGLLEAFDGIEAIAVIVGVIVAVLLAIFFLIPLLLIVFDVLVILLLFVLGTAARVVLHRPWEIEAVGPRDEQLSWKVVGWNRSRRTIRAIADILGQGEALTASSPGLPAA